MAVSVDIADRRYDYTDEEKVSEAIAAFQSETGLEDQAIVDLWADEGCARRLELERLIFDAVDANGSVSRARKTIPVGITLFTEEACI